MIFGSKRLYHVHHETLLLHESAIFPIGFILLLPPNALEKKVNALRCGWDQTMSSSNRSMHDLLARSQHSSSDKHQSLVVAMGGIIPPLLI